MLKIFVVQCHPRNIFNIELFPNYGITFNICSYVATSIIAIFVATSIIFWSYLCIHMCRLYNLSIAAYDRMLSESVSLAALDVTVVICLNAKYHMGICRVLMMGVAQDLLYVSGISYSYLAS